MKDKENKEKDLQRLTNLFKDLNVYKNILFEFFKQVTHNEKIAIDIANEIIKESDIDNLVQKNIKIYDEIFNHQEIKKIIKFYESSIGKKLIENAINIHKKITDNSVEWMREIISNKENLIRSKIFNVLKQFKDLDLQDLLDKLENNIGNNKNKLNEEKINKEEIKEINKEEINKKELNKEEIDKEEIDEEEIDEEEIDEEEINDKMPKLTDNLRDTSSIKMPHLGDEKQFEDANRIADARYKFAEKYSKEMGWDINNLNITQILEIRMQDDWINPKI